MLTKADFLKLKPNQLIVATEGQGDTRVNHRFLIVRTYLSDESYFFRRNGIVGETGIYCKELNPPTDFFTKHIGYNTITSSRYHGFIAFCEDQAEYLDRIA